MTLCCFQIRMKDVVSKSVQKNIKNIVVDVFVCVFGVCDRQIEEYIDIATSHVCHKGITDVDHEKSVSEG